MAKSKRDNVATRPAGDAGATSGASSPDARAWTAEEMAGAKPLPIPGTGVQGQVPAAPPAGVSHAGHGNLLPAGSPEIDGDDAA